MIDFNAICKRDGQDRSRDPILIWLNSFGLDPILIWLNSGLLEEEERSTTKHIEDNILLLIYWTILYSSKI